MNHVLQFQAYPNSQVQLFEQPFTHIHNEGVTGVFPDIEQIARLQKIVEELGVVTDAATV